MFAQPLCQAYFLNAKPLFFVLLMLAVGQEGKLYLRTRQETGRHDGFKGHGGNCTLLQVPLHKGMVMTQKSRLMDVVS